MNLKKIFFLIFAVSFLQAIEEELPFAQEEEADISIFSQEHEAASCPVLILLDDSEKGLDGALSLELIQIISQKPSPLLVSTYLLINLVSHIKEKLGLEDILKKEWIIKKVEDSIKNDMYLLVPKEYLKVKNITEEAFNGFLKKTDPLTSVEYALGLKVNHMQTVGVDQLSSFSNKLLRWPWGNASYVTPLLSAIFIPSKEYYTALKKDPKIPFPAYTLYITGHGMTNDTICSLKIEDFKKFLTFFTKTKIKIVDYSSCYAGGINQEALYKDSQSFAAIYDFPIINSSTADITTKVSNSADFKLFIEKIDANEYLKAVQAINTDKNIPQIRYPGMAVFFPLDRTVAVSIGSVMAKTRTNPLDIAVFFRESKDQKASPTAVLLYAKEIPFDIISTLKSAARGDYVPFFISMIPGKAVHILKKIVSSNQNILAIVSAFLNEDIAMHKIFFIQEIEAQLGLLFPNKTNKEQKEKFFIKNVAIYGKKKRVYFVAADNELYLLEADKSFEAKKAGFFQKREYVSLMTEFEVEKKFAAFPSFTSSSQKITDALQKRKN